MPIFGDRAAMLALAARLDRRAAFAVGSDAVEGAGDDACGRRLADAADAREDEGMGDAAGGDRVGERPNHRLLADEFREGCRTIFAREHAIDAARLAHVPASPWEPRWETERRPRPELVTAASFRT